MFESFFNQFFNNGQPPRSRDRATKFRSVSERAYAIKDISSQSFGRIRYLATDWNACADDGENIPAGTEVIPIKRQGNTWFVVPVTSQSY